jgi:protein-S-isoprenylcysteine O-methyltransferase Ste14
MKAFWIMGRVIKGAYEELFLIVGLSIAWWAGTLLIVTAPMATAGIQKAGNRIANYKRVDFGYFWEGARTHMGRNVLLYLLLLLAPPLMAFSVSFYFDRQGWIVTLGVVMMWMLLVALMAGQYCYPLFWQQNEPSLKLVLRNALVLAVRHPLYSVLMLLFQLLLAAISVVLVVPLVLLLPGVIALCQNYALVGLLQELGMAPPPPELSGT